MSNTLAHNITLSDLEKRGGGLPDSERPVIFKGHQFGGTAAHAENPLDSIPAFEQAVRSEYETVTQTAEFDEFINDLSVSAARTAKRLHGGIARSVRKGFKLPEERTIETGYDSFGNMTYETVPGSWMSMPGLQNTMFRAIATNSGSVLEFQYPRILRPYIDGFIQMVRDEIRDNSIYRGKVITTHYDYIWVKPIDPDHIIYNESVEAVLGPWALSTLRNVEANEKLGLSNKVGILLAGQPGTGKTLFIQLLMHVAKTLGCTVVVAAPGADVEQLGLAHTISKRYMVPGKVAVIIAEDIEKVASHAASRSRLLEIMDGAATKGNRSLFVTTTNFPELIDPAMIRPGRIDQLVFTELPDVHSFEKLIKLQLSAMLADDVDFAEAFPAFEGYTQSWIVGSTESVLRAAVWREGSADNLTITTKDLIMAADAYRPQFEMQNTSATRKPETPTLDAALQAMVYESMERVVSDYEFVSANDKTDYDAVETAADCAIENRLDGANVLLETETGKPISGKLNTK